MYIVLNVCPKWQNTMSMCTERDVCVMKNN